MKGKKVFSFFKVDDISNMGQVWNFRDFLKTGMKNASNRNLGRRRKREGFS